MLFFGKVLAFMPPKIVFLVSIIIFEIGSLLSAIAPSVIVLIFGRAVSGFGGVGLYVSILSIVARVCFVVREQITVRTQLTAHSRLPLSNSAH